MPIITMDMDVIWFMMSLRPSFLVTIVDHTSVHLCLSQSSKPGLHLLE